MKQNWEKEFDEIYNDNKTNIVTDLRLKDFIKSLLTRRDGEILKMIEECEEGKRECHPRIKKLLKNL